MHSLTAALAAALYLITVSAQAADLKIRITTGSYTMTATPVDNATFRAFTEKLPLPCPPPRQRSGHFRIMLRLP